MAKRSLDVTPMRTLFVGNSHTYVNEVNLQVAAMARAAGDVAPMKQWRITPGGWTWQRHWTHTGVPGFLTPGAYDCVVLQENSLGWIENHDDAMKFGRLLCDRVREIGATPVLYLTWPRSDFQQIQPMITESCVQIARDCGASVAPAGEAWKSAMAKRKRLVLHSPDRCHANETGSYLAALVLFATIYNRTPVGLPGRITVTNDKGETKTVVSLRKPLAAFLQTVAWQTVKAFRKPKSRKSTRK